jgi:hypothetical protein
MRVSPYAVWSCSLASCPLVPSVFKHLSFISLSLYKTIRKIIINSTGKGAEVLVYESWILKGNNVRTGSRDTSVGIATSLRFGRPMSRSSIPGMGKRFFSLHNVQTDSGAHPVSYTMGTRAVSPQVKRQVKNGEATPPLLHTSHGMVLN